MAVTLAALHDALLPKLIGGEFPHPRRGTRRRVGDVAALARARMDSLNRTSFGTDRSCVRGPGHGRADDVAHETIDVLCHELFGATEEMGQIIEHYWLLRSAGCAVSVALRTTLDDWSNRRVNDERRIGIRSGYRRGPHWERVTTVGRLLAGDRCEYEACSACGPLQAHHHHYESVGWESLYAISMLCDGCHRRVSHGGAYIEHALRRIRAEEMSQRDRALRTLGESTPGDGASIVLPPDLDD